MTPLLSGALALALLLGGCDWSHGQSARTRLVVTAPASCDVGGRPGYYVPGPAAALLGCARLGVSGKRVEFSGNLAVLDGEEHMCVNPAYSGRGRPGFHIPAICKLGRPLSRFAAYDAGRPSQGAGGYAFVIWGTAGASTEVRARFTGGTARAAILDVAPRLAERLGEPPFRLFVVELPLSAACAPVTLTNGTGASERIPARTEVCAASLRN